MIFLEVGGLDGLIFLLILIMIGPSILLAIIGGVLFYNKNRKAGKVFFILAVAYLIIAFGICGALMSGGY